MFTNLLQSSGLCYAMNGPQMSSTRKSEVFVSFPHWLENLEASDLDEKVIESYKITIRWFLGFCKSSGEKASTKVAKSFLEQIKKEKDPTDWIYQSWRQALLWFFKHAPNEDHTYNTPESLPDPREAWELALVKRIRAEQKSYRTEQNYRGWMRRFLRFISKESDQLDIPDLENYMDHLARVERVSASTQRQALNALVYWFRHIKGATIPDDLVYKKAAIKKNLPVVLTKNEIGRLVARLSGRYALMAKLQYGAGLRVSELVRLRVKDLDCYSAPCL